jgi:aminopeptidase N
MKDAAPQSIRLSDYRPPNHLIDAVALTFKLSPKATRVLARIEFRPNPEGLPDGDLRLDGENLRLIRCSINGKPLTALDYLLTVHPMRGRGVPQDHLYYPDRPDVMAPDLHRAHRRRRGRSPVLLSNGNPLQGRGESGSCGVPPRMARPLAQTRLSLRAGGGRSGGAPDSFTTASGRDVELNIWVRPGDEDKCAYAMDALKRSMRWDEEVYGREYDLDVFNIVAVDDFNMGAMENKGLNIFNSKYVCWPAPRPRPTAITSDRGIIAHEYFHNWTGNRITCRDWFQLCLKEGLTVFRDQQFTADMRSPRSSASTTC